MGKQSLLLPPKPKHHLLVVDDEKSLSEDLVDCIEKRYPKAFHALKKPDLFNSKIWFFCYLRTQKRTQNVMQMMRLIRLMHVVSA
jgi:hypothetical protein